MADKVRVHMTEEQEEKFLAKYLKDRGLKGAAADKYIRHIAATRLGALARNNKKKRAEAPPAKKGKGKK